MEWIVTAIAVAILLWWFYERQGKLSFWKLAARYPEEAYQFFMQEDCWFVDDVPEGVSKDDVMGPFKLMVPSLGRLIAVYALADRIEESQERFKQRFS